MITARPNQQYLPPDLTSNNYSVTWTLGFRHAVGENQRLSNNSSFPSPKIEVTRWVSLGKPTPRRPGGHQPYRGAFGVAAGSLRFLWETLSVLVSVCRPPPAFSLL